MLTLLNLSRFFKPIIIIDYLSTCLVSYSYYAEAFARRNAALSHDHREILV